MPAIGIPNTLSSIADLGSLRYVQAIASCQSLTAAARELRVSQPTLSTAVRGLERRLGTTLFLRHAGEEIHGIESSPTGQFVIGCYHSVGAIFLPGLTTALATRAPGIQLSFWEGIGPLVI